MSSSVLRSLIADSFCDEIPSNLDIDLAKKITFIDVTWLSTKIPHYILHVLNFTNNLIISIIS